MELESELTSVELFVAFSQNEAMYSCFQQDDTPVTAKNEVSEHLLEIRFHKVKSGIVYRQSRRQLGHG